MSLHASFTSKPPDEAAPSNSKEHSPQPETQQAADWLSSHLMDAPAEAVIGAALGRFGDRFALVSSFGAESAVLLHIAARVSTDIPVLFLDTQKLFGETKRYRDTLIQKLGLKNVQTILPDPQDALKTDPKGHLWATDANKCCFIRKVAPLHKALEGFEAWASGRKRFQGGLRENINHFEFADNRVKVNPLALWSRKDVDRYIKAHDLPQHPLVGEGYRSIGCMPCTERVSASETGTDLRAGRWKGQTKSECGIHLNWRQNLELFEGGEGI